MKKSVRQYLDAAENRVMNQYSNAEGFIDDDLSFTGEDFFNATGGAQQPAQNVPVSQPYIVNITSASGANVANFPVLGSYEYLFNSGFDASGNLVIGSITISSGIPDVTYRQMLQQFANSPFSVGLTYIQSATAGQVTQSIAVNTRDANGNLAQKTFIPTIDPYQQQSGIVAMKFPFRIDGYTKLVLAQVLANAQVQLQLYPADNVNLARALAGNAVSKQFGAPAITSGQTIKIKA